MGQSQHQRSNLGHPSFPRAGGFPDFLREHYRTIHVWDKVNTNADLYGDDYNWQLLRDRYEVVDVVRKRTETVRETRLAYDEHNRLNRVYAPTGQHVDGTATVQISELKYDYDELNNRRRIRSEYNKAT